MENTNSFSRRIAVKSSLFGLLAIPVCNVLFAKNNVTLKEISDQPIPDRSRYPAIDESIVAEVVGVSHLI